MPILQSNIKNPTVVAKTIDEIPNLHNDHHQTRKIRRQNISHEIAHLNYAQHFKPDSGSCNNYRGALPPPWSSPQKED